MGQLLLPPISRHLALFLLIQDHTHSFGMPQGIRKLD